MDLNEIEKRIGLMKRAAEELSELSHGFPALKKNIVRILASIKILEMNVSDVLNLEKQG